LLDSQVESGILTILSHPSEGRLENVTDAGWDAVDAGGGARRATLEADGEVVWSWRSEAGAKSAMMLTHRADDGGNQAMVTGESTYKP
jgi:hypothetical protein